MVNRYWQTFALLLYFLAAGAVCAAERPIVREVIATPEGNGARIEILADKQLAYRSYLMPELAKWVIDLPGAKTTYFEDESKKMRTPPLERITVRQKEVNGDLFTRIGLDFKGEVDFYITADPLDKGRLVAIMTPSKATLPILPAVESPSVSPRSPLKIHAAAPESTNPSLAQPVSGSTAKTVTDIRITTDAIRITADGRVTVPKPLSLTRPGRLVLDMADVTSVIKTVPVPAANRFGIVQCRLGKSGDKLRIVFEVKGDVFPDFQLKEMVDGVEITPRR